MIGQPTPFLLPGVTMLDRWRLAIVFPLFGFLASGALIVRGSMGSNSDLETRLGRVIDVACPAHLLMAQVLLRRK